MVWDEKRSHINFETRKQLQNDFFLIFSGALKNTYPTKHLDMTEVCLLYSAEKARFGKFKMLLKIGLFPKITSTYYSSVFQLISDRLYDFDLQLFVPFLSN